MELKKRWYNETTYIEEVFDEHENETSIKQWNNGELVIHREWVYKSKHIWTWFKDFLENREVIKSYHYLGDWTITNTFTVGSGKNDIHYCKIVVVFEKERFGIYTESKVNDGDWHKETRWFDPNNKPPEPSIKFR